MVQKKSSIQTNELDNRNGSTFPGRTFIMYVLKEMPLNGLLMSAQTLST